MTVETTTNALSTNSSKSSDPVDVSATTFLEQPKYGTFTFSSFRIFFLDGIKFDPV